MKKALYPMIILLVTVYGFNISRSIDPSVNIDEDKHVQHNHEEHDEREHDEHNHEEHEHEHQQDEHKDHVDNNQMDHRDDELDDHNHEEHDSHDHGASDSNSGIHLTPEQYKSFGIVLSPVSGGKFETRISLPGEIIPNEDRLVHLSPKVAGTVKEVRKNLGDYIKAGEVLAVLDSRDLADTKSEYLAAKARLSLAQAEYSREKTLKNKKISSEQDFLNAQTKVIETEIRLMSLEQKLYALDFSKADLKNLSNQHYTDLIRYEVIAPINGTILLRHASLGENIDEDTETFIVSDLSTVWVDLIVYPKDLALVQVGQEILIRSEFNSSPVLGKIAMVTPFVDVSTRTATARAVIENSQGNWLPGTFVTGEIIISGENAAVIIPKSAVQRLSGEEVIFIEVESGFITVPVLTGRSDRTHIEILAGLNPGTTIVTEGAFNLKATMVTQNLDPHAGHGH